jgi:hypothetical protein
MDKPKQKVNAKKFLEDFRAGKSETELMEAYGLNRVTLEKLFNLLIDKKLLDHSEMRPMRIDAPLRNAQRPRVTQITQPPGPIEQTVPYTGVSERAAHYDSTQCPQCGAAVSKRVLTCPECGHVLPGEERWEGAEPKRRLVDQIPPKVLGCIIALPIAVAFFFLFRDIILPMSESAISKRADSIRQETRGEAPLKLAREMGKVGSSNVIKFEVERLVAEGTLESASEDFSVFVAGAGWNELSHEGKLGQLSELREALKNSGMAPDFQLVAESGQVLASVQGRHIRITDQVPPDTTIPGHVAAPEPRPEPATPSIDEGAIERAVERRLPAGLDRKFPNMGR